MNRLSSTCCVFLVCLAQYMLFLGLWIGALVTAYSRQAVIDLRSC